MISVPRPGTPGHIQHRTDGSYFWAECGSVWKIVGNHPLPVPEDQAQAMSEEFGYCKTFGPEPVRMEPYVWPDHRAETVEPKKTEPKKIDPVARRRELKALMSDLCMSGDFTIRGRSGESYQSKISQVVVGEMLGHRLNPVPDFDPVHSSTVRSDLKIIGITVDWSLRKN